MTDQMSTLHQQHIGSRNDRVAEHILDAQVASLRDNPLVHLLLDATGLMVMILNDRRQILYASSGIRSMLDMPPEEALIGLRPGDAVGCIHAGAGRNGCGGSAACRNCSTLRLILEAISLKTPTTGDASLQVSGPEGERTLNMLEHVVPVELLGIRCYIVSFVDISDTLYRRWLERLFFHDIVNKIGALSNYMRLMRQDLPPQFTDEMGFVEQSFREVLDDIRVQKNLLDAENGELQPEWMRLDPDDLLAQLVRLYRANDLSRGKRIEQDDTRKSPHVTSDYLLLRRVLENMIKNALEASPAGSVVRVGTDGPEKDAQGCDFVTIWVWNDAVLDAQARTHMFRRSWSTKGGGRGLGTYSMKLFGERVLGGMVEFRSESGEGTRFWIRLPVSDERERGKA